MARGFVGRASSSYFSQVKQASSSSAAAVGAAGGRAGVPGAEEEAILSYPVGIGTSANIAVDEDVYAMILRQVEQTDQEMAEKLYGIITRIQDMCREDFVLPDATPKIDATIAAVEQTLGDFQEVTERAAGVLRGFVAQIGAADQ